MLKFARLLLIALLFTGCSKEPEPKPTTPLMIKTANGDVRFMVEVANTPEDLQTGLMHRTNLGITSGMIFNIYPVRPTAMWMKNTKIPLDMLFVAPDATISMIKENAEPMSEAQIISRDPVRAVIEINAGQVKRHGIKVGDKVTHMILNNVTDVKTPGPEAEAADPAVGTPNAPQAPQAEIPVPTLKVEPKTSAASEPAAAGNLPAKPAPIKAPAPVQPKVPVPAPAL